LSPSWVLGKSSRPRRTPPGDTGGKGRGGSRGQGCQPRSRAAPGQNARPALRPVCGDKTPAALGRQGADNTRSSVVPSQEARELELSGGVRSLPQVPWWDAERRARDASRAAASADAVHGVCVSRRSASFFCFVLCFVLCLACRSVIEPKNRSHRRLGHDAIGLRRTITAVALPKLGRGCVSRDRISMRGENAPRRTQRGGPLTPTLCPHATARGAREARATLEEQNA
jgi:hypothetical protein